jgi:uncharacterized protein YjiS (DUF1127 family)
MPTRARAASRMVFRPMQEEHDMTYHLRDASSIVRATQTCPDPGEAVIDHSQRRKRPQLRDIWNFVCDMVELWRQRHDGRAELRSLDMRDIRDFCPDYAEALNEMKKPCWKA